MASTSVREVVLGELVAYRGEGVLGPADRAAAAKRKLVRVGRLLLERESLRIVRELAYPDVANRLGITEQAARARVSRALRALGGTLDDITAAER